MPERNRLLRKLTDDDLSALLPALEAVTLKKGQALLIPHQHIEYVYFPLDCACSVLAKTEPAHTIEVGMFGFEGMSCLAIRPNDRPFFASNVFLAGTALRISAERFSTLRQQLPSLSEVVLRYREVSAVQFGFTALAIGEFTIESRLARWLLMALDRVGDRKQFPVVHDLIASLLSVRRAGVTLALHSIEGTGAIKSTRGLIRVRDREKLLEIAGGCYGPSENAYEVIMGNQPDRPLHRVGASLLLRA
jgi:CRP-like cAMP-binding protein